MENETLKAKSKKKNAKKACHHCKKSHKKCDNFRPCTNCVKYKKTCFNDSKKNKNEKSITQNMLPIITKTLDRIYTLDDLNGIVDPSVYIDKYADQIGDFVRFESKPGYELIKREKEKKEEEKLQLEIEEIRRKINEEDVLEIPDNLNRLDPIEFLLIKQNIFSQGIPLNFLPDQGKRAGTMFLAGRFGKNLSPNNFYAKSFIISNISECFTLSFGMTPKDMIGKKYVNYCPDYSENTFANKGNVKRNEIYEIPLCAISNKKLMPLSLI